MTQMFDPNMFMQMTVEGENSTVFVPVPAGEYIAVIKEVKAREWKNKEDPSKAGMALDVFWSIDDAGVKQLLERDEVVVKQGVMLDVTPNGGLDMGKGKNVGLGRLREACNLNQAGRPFGFSMLTGQAAKVVVEHRADPKNPEAVYAEVKAVAKLA